MGGITMHGSMIQASSLAEVQAIADDPPAKPSLRRAHGSQLTLYIARVPGSKDIFLTTLKPKEKVVSAQDVESSLYYCHMESDQDSDLLQERPELLDGGELPTAVDPDAGPSSPEDETTGQHPPPVPPHFVMPVGSQTAPELPPRPQGVPSAVKRKPVGANGDQPLALPAAQPENPPPLVPPRPLGARDLNQGSNFSSGHHLGISLEGALSEDGDGPKTPPKLPRRPISAPKRGKVEGSPPQNFPQSVTGGKENHGQRPRTSHSGVPRSSHSFDGSWSGSTPLRRPSLSTRSTSSTVTRTSSLSSAVRFTGNENKMLKGFNVILIRRDPATGSQTNIGKISIPPVYSRYGRPGKALLQIFNHGYEKFRAAHGTSTADLVRCISEDENCTYSCDLRLATRRQSLKGPSTPYFGDVPVNQLIAVTPSQPYSFVSPWNRVCEFSTGVSGRSLKCRHMLARGTLVDENPNDMNVLCLSELRFNTPSSSVFSKVGQRRSKHTHSSSGNSLPSVKRKPMHNTAAGTGSERVSNDSSGHNTFDGIFDAASITTADYHDHVHDHDEEHNEDEDYHQENDWDFEPMNLALGQEKPGGGFKGNKAKLGKLVIEPEGLEMLDLLVAANMGIWWSIR